MKAREFKRRYGREKGVTSEQYLHDGAYSEIFEEERKVFERYGKSLWGYDRVEEVTTRVIRSRIKYMRDKIAAGTWEGRQLRFAKHHLATLVRKLEKMK